MKVVILCGGLGTRLHDETVSLPKPMLPVGDRPLLWHIMETYAQQGFTDFVLALGYKGDLIRDYFVNYPLRGRDVQVLLGSGSVIPLRPSLENWTVTLVESGEETQTAGRLLRCERYLDSDEPFMLTYGDGLADVDLRALRLFHQSWSDKYSQPRVVVTVTGVHQPGRFGALSVDGPFVKAMNEKPHGQEGLINGGYMVCSPEIFNRQLPDDLDLADLLVELAAANQLAVREHAGFWQAVDTPRDLELVRRLWREGNAPWAQAVTHV